MIHPCPKPERTEKPFKRSSLTRTIWLKSTTPIKKENPERRARKAKNMRKHYASPEYKAARAEQLERSGGRCEVRHLIDEHMRVVAVLLPGEDPPVRINDSPKEWFISRCLRTTKLEFHEVHYGSDLGIIRPIKGYICCEADHQYIEVTRHPTRKRR